MELACGTYERRLHGFEVDETTKTLKKTIKHGSHQGCIKALASRGSLLLSGSTDECIKYVQRAKQTHILNVRVYDMSRRVEIGTLMQHEGTITSIVFSGASHMISASEDQTVIVWRVNGWEPLRVLRGHKGPVWDVAVHPSGKLALSSSGDRTLRMWNLSTGRCAYTTNRREQESHLVRWNGEGDHYALASGNTVSWHSTSTNVGDEPVNTLRYDGRVCCMEMTKENHILIGGDDGHIHLVDIRTKKEGISLGKHPKRVRGVVELVSIHGIATGASDGVVRLWDARQPADTWSEVDVVDRITCLVGISPEEEVEEMVPKKQPKRPAPPPSKGKKRRK